MVCLWGVACTLHCGTDRKDPMFACAVLPSCRTLYKTQFLPPQARARRKAEVESGGKSAVPRVGLSRSLTKDDVSAPPELRAALLQVSQGVEHLHSLRIVHRSVDLSPESGSREV